MPFGKPSLVLQIGAFFGRYSDSLDPVRVVPHLRFKTLLNYLTSFGEDNYYLYYLEAKHLICKERHPY